MDRLKERQKVYLKNISSGVFDKFEDYKLCVGILKGLEEAEGIVTEMYGNLFESRKLNERGKENDEREDRLY